MSCNIYARNLWTNRLCYKTYDRFGFYLPEKLLSCWKTLSQVWEVAKSKMFYFHSIKIVRKMPESRYDAFSHDATSINCVFQYFSKFSFFAWKFLKFVLKYLLYDMLRRPYVNYLKPLNEFQEHERCHKIQISLKKRLHSRYDGFLKPLKEFQGHERTYLVSLKLV